MPAKKRPPLSETQIAIMNVVWDRGEVSIGELYREFSAARDVARNTVLTLTTRLYEKGWLKRRRRGNAHLYRAAVPREKTLAAMVRSLKDTAFRGSAEGLVMTLLEETRLTPEAAQRIREMIDAAQRESEEEDG
jgi:predicted transcriptional regulator